jgi:Asp-tRNA(Asn)/Glu-tRNA(Gln) amidotransferase A subunit family amidase
MDYVDFGSDPELVLSQARALDQIPHEQRGPLHGVAIGIKDIMNTRGTVWHPHGEQHNLFVPDMPTQFGFPIYEGHRSASDSSAVAILRAAGALIFGSSTLTLPVPFT